MQRAASRRRRLSGRAAHRRATTSAADRLAERPAPQILLLHAGAVGAAQWDTLFTWLERENFRFATRMKCWPIRCSHKSIAMSAPSAAAVGSPRKRARCGDRGEKVQALLREQAAAWSRGDVDAFCSVYADDRGVPVADGGNARSPGSAGPLPAAIPRPRRHGALTWRCWTCARSAGPSSPLWGCRSQPCARRDGRRALDAGARTGRAGHRADPLVLRRARGWLGIVQDASM